MQDTYLTIFKELFFDVSENKEVKSIIEQASYVYSMLIVKFGEVQNEMAEKENSFVDSVIVLFVRKIMEQLDAINILYSSCAFEQSSLILRSLIENIISLEFILKDDTENRAAAYYLYHHYQEIDIGNDYFNENTQYGKLAIKTKGKEQYDKDCEKFEHKKQALNRLIQKEAAFQIVDQKRKEKLAKKQKRLKNRKANVKWYEICSDITSVYGLMRAVGYEKYYNGIYGTLSFETHGLNAAMGMDVDNNELFLKMIRSPQNGSATFGIVCGFSIGIEVLY